MYNFQQILQSRKLSLKEAYELQKSILENRLPDSELLKIFALLDRPLELDEFQGLYKASEEVMVRVNTNLELLDTCGTGGDGLKTFNISTAAAILCSALGVPVAKHGNRSASSQCGSADLLEELGVKIDLSSEQVVKCIEATGFCFMFAQKFHPAFKNVSPARKAFGKRTYFNFLGPLLNPASATFRLLGVSDPRMADIMGETLMKAGVKKALVVHSHEGMDEISATGKTDVLEFTPNSEVKKYTINPSDYGFENVSLAELSGGDKKLNAQIIKNVLSGQGSAAQTNAVVLNAAAGLVLAGKASNYSEAITMSKQAIEQKLGLQKLDQIIKFTNQL